MKFILQHETTMKVFCLSLLIGALMTLAAHPSVLRGNAPWGVGTLIEFMASTGTCFFGILAVLKCKTSGDKKPDIRKIWPLVAIALVLSAVPSLIGTAGSGDSVQIFRANQ